MADSTITAPTGLARRLFGFGAPIDRRTYVIAGLALMALKYWVELVVVKLATGTWWSPLDYFAPRNRAQAGTGIPHMLFNSNWLGAVPQWLPWALAAWTLPFIWIGVSMSVRRAANAGVSPWAGLMFLVPWLNYVLILLLAVLPTSSRGKWCRKEKGGEDPPLGHAVVCSLAGLAAALAVVYFGTKVASSYGLYLFVGMPLVFGSVLGFFLNRPVVYSSRATGGVVAATFIVLAFLIGGLAIEGLGCILMSLPIAIPLAILGAVLGQAIAICTTSRSRQAFMSVLLLPLLAAFDRHGELPVHEVVSSIEIEAAPEVVWRHLVGFGTIPDPPEWMFRLGIACPEGARIEGEGVGAVRRCEFSTGPFVEPITAWEPPVRLAFDVASQPPPMVEWSPFDIHPAHLDGYLQSRRGEFRLVALPGGRTRLEGSTWYTLDIHPAPYWGLYADFLIGSIHDRVLRHVRRLSEAR